MAVPTQGVCRVPVGFKFRPTEEELLLYYLRRKNKRLRLPQGFIHDCHVYAKRKEPWDLWEAYRNPSDPETKHLYFFTIIPGVVFSCNTIRRVDTGKWRGEKTRKKVFASGSDRVIGWRRTFVYRNRDSDQDGRWRITELDLYEPPYVFKLNGFVLCILTKLDKKENY